MKPNALTVVLNPHARKPRLRMPSVEKLKRVLGPDSRILLTRTLPELERVVTTLKGERETLCFYGGDGSISCGLTLLIRSRGDKAPLPPILAVRAGTINMLCSALGFRQSPDKTFERWRRNELDTLRRIPTLKVECEGKKPIYGFVFAWGVGYRVLCDYYGRSPTPNVVDGFVVMAKTFLNACRPDARTTPMFRAHDLKLVIDGDGGAKAEAGEIYSLAAGTIDRLSLGLRPFPPGQIHPGTFHITGNGMPVAKVAWHSPTLLYRLGDQRVLARSSKGRLVSATGARELRAELTEGFTMDGEMHEIRGTARVRISAGPVVEFWTAGERR